MKVVEHQLSGLSRRRFLTFCGASALWLSSPRDSSRCFAQTTGGKPLRGIFPIAQTPFTADDKLDLDVLGDQVRFIDRARVHGFVWPQLASEWSSLTEQERLAGMEVIGAAGKGLRPAIVLGVQGPDLETVKRYIRQAEKVGANAIISLPPAENADRATVLDYYQQVGRSSSLPLFVQAVGNMDVDLVMEMYRTIPTMRYVKDEVAKPLPHGIALREQSMDQIKLFSGNHGKTLMEELSAGFSGSMPAAGLADLYAQTFELWQSGERDAAREMHARTLEALNKMVRYGMAGMKYVLIERGVFKTYGSRTNRSRGFDAAQALATGGSKKNTLSDSGKEELREMLRGIKPYLRA